MSSWNPAVQVGRLLDGPVDMLVAEHLTAHLHATVVGVGSVHGSLLALAR